MSALVSLAVPPVPAKDITISVGPFTIQNTDGTDDTIEETISQPIEIIQGGPKEPALKIALMPPPAPAPAPSPAPKPAVPGAPLVPPVNDQGKPLIVQINSFAASPQTIQRGQSATLAWSVANSGDVSINPGIGAVAPSGSQQVSPQGTTSYVLTAKNQNGSDTRTVVVTVQ
jgi:hypothetical protein